MPNHRCRRRVAFGVYDEGLYQMDGLNTHQQGVWGGRLSADLEVADAEMYAIHEYLHTPESFATYWSQRGFTMCTSTE
jgi:hypothetical protein